jgi:hypothetical protein
MEAITLPAHFDGRQIRLDEPFEMEPDTKLMVTVLPKVWENEERQDWNFLAVQGLQGAYGEDEPEYSLIQLKEVNPDYDRR